MLCLVKVWRLSFFLGLVPVAGMLCWRLFKLEESTMWRDKQKRLQQEVLFCQCTEYRHRFPELHILMLPSWQLLLDSISFSAHMACRVQTDPLLHACQAEASHCCCRAKGVALTFGRPHAGPAHTGTA